MNVPKSRGRPVKGRHEISRTEIISKALDLLAAKGESGLSMRALAKALSVTPMALYHHVGNRDELIAALVARVFGDVATTDTEEATSLVQIEELLISYCKRITERSELVLLAFRNPEAFSGPLVDITDLLRSRLGSLGLCATEVERWLGVLIDYTHGFALSQASTESRLSEGELQSQFVGNIRLFLCFAERAVTDRN